MHGRGGAQQKAKALPVKDAQEAALFEAALFERPFFEQGRTHLALVGSIGAL